MFVKTKRGYAAQQRQSPPTAQALMRELQFGSEVPQPVMNP